jgi:hypothetical protein
MKRLIPVFLIIICSLSTSAQELFNDFEDGTLQGWTNTDGTETAITNEEESGNKYLQKVADGSITAQGRLSVANTTDTWTGDNYGGGFNIFGALNFSVKNDNNFDMKIRLGFRGGSDDTILVTTDPLTVPANSGWNNYTLETYEPTTVVSGKATVIEVATNTLEFRIIHSEEVSWEGDAIAGSLAIDNLNGILLDNEDFLKETVRISPNPFQNKLKIELPVEEGVVSIFDVLGRKILTENLSRTTTLDLRKLKSGIYLANIITEAGRVTKRIIKN